MKEPLIFDIALGQTKPNSMHNRDGHCPFCEPSQLTDILDTSGSIIWLMNKYPVLKHTWPTVIIETPPHVHTEYSKLPLLDAVHILEFGRMKWEEVKSDPRFTSVLFFKNYGPMSGGSIYHPHSQIIGLEDYDYREDIHREHFEGWIIYEEDGLRITLSNHPIHGFFEFNMRFNPQFDTSILAKYLQRTLRYVLEGFSKYVKSYNLFFYDINDGYHYLKIVPRYITSPLFIGYGIPQVCHETRALEVIRHIQSYLHNSLEV